MPNKLLVNTDDYEEVVDDDAEYYLFSKLFYNCPNPKCEKHFGYDIYKEQKYCDECGCKLIWKFKEIKEVESPPAAYPPDEFIWDDLFKEE